MLPVHAWFVGVICGTPHIFSFCTATDGYEDGDDDGDHDDENGGDGVMDCSCESFVFGVNGSCVLFSIFLLGFFLFVCFSVGSKWKL